MFKIKINDTVKITAGKDKGQSGKVLKVYPIAGKVLVEGKNTYKKHVKPTGKEAGQIVTLSRPISVASVSVICPTCQKATRIGLEGEGKTKVRICKKCHTVINIAKKS